MSSRSIPRAGQPATSPHPPLRCLQSSPHQRRAPPHSRGPAHRRGAGCLPDKSCRRAGRSGTGLRLRLTIELPLKGPDLFRSFKAHHQSPCPHHLRKRTRSQGPSLRRYYPASTVHLTLSDSRRSRRLSRRRGRYPRPRRVSPDYPHHLSGVPCPLPQRTERVLLSIASPFARPSPNLRRVGVRTFTFEACSGFTRVTARQIAQPPKAAFVTRLRRSQLPG